MALSKIYDRDTRVAGLRKLREALQAEGRADLAKHISTRLNPLRTRITAIMAIRSQPLVHNEHAVPRTKAYKLNGITPNQIRALIDETATVINHVARELGISNTIFESDRSEKSTLRMLETLERGSN